MIRQKLGKERSQRISIFHHIKSPEKLSTWLIIADVNADHLAETVMLLHCQVTHPQPSFSKVLSERKSLCTVYTLKSRELCFTLLKREYTGINYWIMYRTSASSPFIYLFSHLFIPAWSHGCLFYTLGCNPALLYTLVILLLKLIQLCPVGVLSVGSNLTLDIFPSL